MNFLEGMFNLMAEFQKIFCLQGHLLKFVLTLGWYESIQLFLWTTGSFGEKFFGSRKRRQRGCSINEMVLCDIVNQILRSHIVGFGCHTGAVILFMSSVSFYWLSFSLFAQHEPGFKFRTAKTIVAISLRQDPLCQFRMLVRFFLRHTN